MDKIDRYQTLKEIIRKNWWVKNKRFIKEYTPEKVAEDIMDCLLDQYPSFFDHEIPKEVFGEKVIKIPWDDPEQIRMIINHAKEVYRNCIDQWERDSRLGVSAEETKARKKKYKECFIVYESLYEKLDEERKAKLIEERKAKEKEERRVLYEKLKKEFES